MGGRRRSFWSLQTFALRRVCAVDERLEMMDRYILKSL